MRQQLTDKHGGLVPQWSPLFKTYYNMQTSFNFQQMRTFEQIEQKIAELKVKKCWLVKDYLNTEDEHDRDVICMENMSLDLQIGLLNWVMGEGVAPELEK